MNTWINYCLEANAGLLLFLLIYRLLLQNETQFTFKRIYLLAGIVLSLVFPLITVPTTSEIIPSVGYILPAEWAELPTDPGLTATQHSVAPVSAWEWVLYAYLSIVVLLVTRFLYQIIRVLRLMSNSAEEGSIITIDNSNIYAFSFFRYIFVSNTHQLSSEDKEKIIRHERVHVQKWHSADMLLIELVRILFWFNPLLKYYKNELSTVHEYEADSISLKPDEIDQYCGLLAKSAISSAGLSIASYFNNSLTLKRIAMLKTMKKKLRQWKTLFILAFMALFFLSVSCQDQIVDASANSIVSSSVSRTVEIIISVNGNPEVAGDIVVSSHIRRNGDKPIVVGNVSADGHPLQEAYLHQVGLTYQPGKSFGTVTDKKGNFELALEDVSPDTELIFSTIILLDEIVVKR